MERRTYETALSVEEPENRDVDSPVLVGHAAVFDRLSENLGGFREIIAREAFADVLGDDVRGLFNHDPSLILGRTTSGTMKISVDETGLRYRIKMGTTQVAKDLMQHVKRGDVSQSSFGFEVDQDTWDEDSEGRIIRTITKVRRLFDVSPVTFPAYPDTDVAKRELRSFCAKRDETKLALYRMRTMQRLGPSLYAKAGRNM